MYARLIHLEADPVFPERGAAGEEFQWYAIHTVARHEKRVAQQLREIGVLTFLPLMQQIRRWSDRWAKVDIPLFSSYAFVSMVQAAEERLRVLRTPGVLGFVGSDRIGTPIPDEEIENLQTAVQEKVPIAVHPFLTVGRRVRVRGGSLDGIEGFLIRHDGDQRLVLSVELLHRSVSIRVEGYHIELV